MCSTDTCESLNAVTIYTQKSLLQNKTTYEIVMIDPQMSSMLAESQLCDAFGRSTWSMRENCVTIYTLPTRYSEVAINTFIRHSKHNMITDLLNVVK